MNHEIRNTYDTEVNPQSAARHADLDDGPGPELMGASTLIGDNIVNQKGEDLGDLKEVMLDTRNGRVGYAVVSFGGFLGMGDKLFAVPWKALTLDTTNKRLVLNVDKKRLKDAPGFDKDHWPDMADPTWEKQVHGYYGTRVWNSDSDYDDSRM
ncbi:MAG: PRC-barrel domain-containing protein [Gammaproteobacteria bacterium]|nr:PRC-barrel domain-containing protein [Gammaproteobacteria bacterium]